MDFVVNNSWMLTIIILIYTALRRIKIWNIRVYIAEKDFREDIELSKYLPNASIMIYSYFLNIKSLTKQYWLEFAVREKAKDLLIKERNKE